MLKIEPILTCNSFWENLFILKKLATKPYSKCCNYPLSGNGGSYVPARHQTIADST